MHSFLTVIEKESRAFQTTGRIMNEEIRAPSRWTYELKLHNNVTFPWSPTVVSLFFLFHLQWGQRSALLAGRCSVTLNFPACLSSLFRNCGPKDATITPQTVCNHFCYCVMKWPQSSKVHSQLHSANWTGPGVIRSPGHVRESHRYSLGQQCPSWS